MSDPTTHSVQMYYVSEGVPVGLGSGQKKEYTGSTTSQLQNGIIGGSSYNPSSAQNGKSVKRADSLESLLSLNVLAAQLLTDHDDLQTVSSPPSRHRDWTRDQSPDPSESYNGTPNSSHHRFHSYSTVSTQAPSTPPPDQQFAESLSANVTQINGKKAQEAGNHLNGYSNETVFHEKSLPEPQNLSRYYDGSPLVDETQSQPREQQEALPSKPRDSPAPRIASMVIKRAISNGYLDEETLAADADLNASPEGGKTPLAEAEQSLTASSSGYTIRFGESSTTRQQDHNAIARSADEYGASYATQAEKDRKGKGRALDQDMDIPPQNMNGIPYNRSMLPIDTTVPFQQSSTSASLAADLNTTPTSPGSRKISEMLKEQYETRQRSGTLDTFSSRLMQTSAEPRPSMSATSIASLPSTQTLSPQGHAPISLKSQESRTSTSKSTSQDERAQLLHSIISQDFAGGSRAVTGGFTTESSHEVPWHPTEYVGPPRRRSISGTSILNFGRKGQANPRDTTAHRRQHSADILTTRANMTNTEGANAPNQLGSRRAFAASADDLLTRKASIQKRSESTLPAQNGFAASKSRLFSIKRKTPPVANMKDLPQAPSEAPFRSMIDTTSLPAQPRATASSSGHKRSLSGSIHSMLSSFGSSSHLRRKRNVSAPENAEPSQHHASQSLSSASASAQLPTPSEFGSYSRQETSSSSTNGTGSGRKSPFKMWRYPSGQSTSVNAGNPANAAVNSVHITQTQLATVSSPTPSENLDARPKSPFFRNPRFQGSSNALSSADTIAEDDGEDEDMLAGSDDGQEEEDDEMTRRLKGLASQQVLRDSDYRARVVEKFKDGERSASSLGLYSTTATDR